MSTETQNEKTEITVENRHIFQHIDELLTCLNGHTFKTSNAELINFCATNASIGDIKYVGEDFEMYEGSDSDALSGYLIACPVCHLVHLHGFDKPSSTTEIAAGHDNSIPVRKLDVDL